VGVRVGVWKIVVQVQTKSANQKREHTSRANQDGGTTVMRAAPQLYHKTRSVTTAATALQSAR